MSEVDGTKWFFDEWKTGWKDLFEKLDKEEVLNEKFEIPAKLKEKGVHFSKFKYSAFSRSLIEDGLSYYWSTDGPLDENGKKTVISHKPKHSIINYKDKNVKKIRCVHPSNQLVKTIVVFDDNVYIVYESSGFDAQLQVRKKISTSLAQEVRETMKHRSVSGAHKVIAEKTNLSKKQVENQSSHCPTRVKSSTGPIPVNVPAHLQQYADEAEYGNFSVYPGTDDWILTICFPRNISLMVTNCPKSKRVEMIRDDIKKLDINELKDATKGELLAKFQNGYCDESSFIQTDTTFNIGNFYVTLMIGVVRNFRTRISMKPRYLILGYMAHTSKSSSNHKKFAEFFNECLSNNTNLKKTRSIPAFITDNEKALAEYTKPNGLLSQSKHLLCDVHLRSVFEHDNKGLITENLIHTVFGKKTNLLDGSVLLEDCLLSALNRSEFDDKLNSLKNICAPKVYEWLTKRQDMLFGSHSMRAKLEALIVQQYVSTNLIECVNKIVKQNTNSNVTAIEFATQLTSFVEDEFLLWKRAVITDDPSNKVLYLKSDDAPVGSYEDNFKKLLKAGFDEVELTFFEIPQIIRKYLPQETRNKNISGIFAYELDRCDDKFYIRNNSSTVCVKLTDLELICESCTKSKTDLNVCIHIIRVICSLPAQDRKVELRKIEEQLNKATAVQKHRMRRTQRSGTKDNRKFSKFSSHNKLRAVDHISSVETISEKEENDLVLLFNHEVEKEEDEVVENEIETQVTETDPEMVDESLEVIESINGDSEELVGIDLIEENRKSNQVRQTSEEVQVKMDVRVEKVQKTVEKEGAQRFSSPSTRKTRQNMEGVGKATRKRKVANQILDPPRKSKRLDAKRKL